jgi:hypothetical protein
MADNHFATLVSKDSAVNAVANPIYTSISDGSETLLIDANGAIAVTDGGLSLTVDGTVAVSSVGGTVTVSATNLDIRDLTHVSDSVKIGDGTDFLAIDGSGNIGVTDAGGTLTVDDGGLSLTVDGTVAVSSVGGTVSVSATDLDIRNLNLTDDAVKVSANTTANGPANPIYVSFTQAAITGEVHDYDTSTVAGNTPDNHDYTVTTAMLVKSIIVGSSGALKAELQVGPVASLATKAVLFIPKVGGSQQVNFDPPIEVPVTSTGTVRIIRTNREASSNDVYSTIIGIDA